MGCEALGATDWGFIDPRQAQDAVRCALDCGISVFDTADAYGLGRGEEELSRALGDDRHRVTIVTKGGIRWSAPQNGGRAPTLRDASASHLTSAIEGSLRRLRIDSIALYLVHWPDPNTPLGETLLCMEQARAAGKILAYGLSNFGGPALQTALAVADVAAVEGPLSLLSPESILKEYTDARSLKVDTLTYGPLAQGLLTGKYTAQSVFDSTDRRHRLDHFSADAYSTTSHVLDALAEVSQEVDRPPAQVAIRWVMDTGLSSSVIFGAKTPSQVLENHAAQSWSLGAAHLERLRIARQLAGLASSAVIAGRSSTA